jgi:uncharacterized protein (TIGR02246 family)
MRVAVLLICGLLLGQGTAPPQGDEAGVRDVVKKYLEFRERRDADSLRALFTEDVDQLVSSGEWRRGREAVVKGTLASSAQTSGARTIVIQTVRFPSRDVAIADGPYEIAGGQQTATRKMWSSFVMVRAGGSWKISAIRNMLPAQPQ